MLVIKIYGRLSGDRTSFDTVDVELKICYSSVIFEHVVTYCSR